jgi:hypothetical protein
VTCLARDSHIPCMNHNTERLLLQLAAGAAAGIAGTVVLQGLQMASKKLMPDTMPPLRGDPAKFMIEQVKRPLPENARQAISGKPSKAAEAALPLAYGMTFGAAYAALRRRGGSPLIEGVALGLLTWAAGYLGWLPATGLMPPVWRQSTKRAVAPALPHTLYGIATVAAYDAVNDRIPA